MYDYIDMNQIVLIILIVSGVTIITSCDSTNDNHPVAVGSTVCFAIVDDLNNSPLASAYVRLTIRDTDRIYSSLTGTSDAQGKCCFKYESSSSLIELFVEKEGYVYFCPGSGYLPSTVRLTAVAYLRLHVKNVPPTDANDQIGITYPDASCSGSQILIFGGPNVDTTVTLTSRPGNGFISWISWHINVRSDSTLSVVMASHDTALVQVLY